MLFGNQLWVLFEGVGDMVGRSADFGPRFYDGLAEAVELNFILKAQDNVAAEMISPHAPSAAP